MILRPIFSNYVDSQAITEEDWGSGCPGICLERGSSFPMQLEDQKLSKASEFPEVQLQGVYPSCQGELHARVPLCPTARDQLMASKINSFPENVRGEYSGLAGIAWLVCSRTNSWGDPRSVPQPMD